MTLSIRSNLSEVLLSNIYQIIQHICPGYNWYILPEEIRLEQCELPCNLNRVKRHQIKLFNISWFADVPFSWRGRVLEGNAVTGHIHLNLLLSLYNLCD